MSGQVHKSTFPKFVENNGEELHTIVEAATMAYLKKLVQYQETNGGGLDRTAAIYTALMGMAWPFSFIARCIGEPPEDEISTEKVTGKELTLTAGLIAGRVLQLLENGVQCDFSGRNVLAAIEAASLVAGYDVKPIINQGMIKSYAEGMEKQGQVSLGYWDHIPEATPSFDEFADQLKNASNFSRSKH